ncbi:MAG: DUF4405 domain-containing protein [Candidatus Aenigmarchaeota archaeon]|nr:DUF4405 domain-containing protein [Candidatus Aenigmarchaeota archaeon]
MNRAKLNYIFGIPLTISFLIVFITGLIKLPELGLHRFGIRMAGITFIHDWAGVLMGVLTIIHIILYWKQIACMTKIMFKRKSAEKCKT